MSAVNRFASAFVALLVSNLLAATAFAAPSGPPIRIGGTLALTGPLASTGVVHQLVADIFVSEINPNSRNNSTDRNGNIIVNKPSFAVRNFIVADE